MWVCRIVFVAHKLTNVHLCQSNTLQMIVIHELQVFKTVTAEAVTFLAQADLLGQEISSPAILDPEFASVEGKR